ncbi:MAG: hypothetical protein U0452_09820 [Anaerolineae bacterium]
MGKWKPSIMRVRCLLLIVVFLVIHNSSASRRRCLGTYWPHLLELLDRTMVKRFELWWISSIRFPVIKVENIFYGWGELLPRQTAIAGGSHRISHGSRHGVDAAAGQFRQGLALDKRRAAASRKPLTSFRHSCRSITSIMKVVQPSGDTASNLELFIDQDLFTAAGLDPDTPTWDELAAAAGVRRPREWRNRYGTVQPGEGLTGNSRFICGSLAVSSSMRITLPPLSIRTRACRRSTTGSH